MSKIWKQLGQLQRATRRILALRCDESCRLQSRKLDDERLGWVDRWAYRGHLLACGTCRTLHRQIGNLDQILRVLCGSQLAKNLPTERIPSAARTRIAQQIQKLIRSKRDE